MKKILKYASPLALAISKRGAAGLSSYAMLMGEGKKKKKKEGMKAGGKTKRRGHGCELRGNKGNYRK